MLSSIARRCSKTDLGLHARHMRFTRSSVKAEIKQNDTVEIQKTTVAVSVPTSSNKRRKATKSGTQQVVVENVTTELIDVKPASPDEKPHKPAKRKAMPKLLQTLHTEDTLPAIQKKAAKVSSGLYDSTKSALRRGHHCCMFSLAYSRKGCLRSGK